MNKKITTIDDLAVIMGKESRAAEKRFGILEEKIEKVVVDIKEIRKDIRGMQGDIKEIRTDLKGIHKDMDSVHADSKDIRTDIKGIHTDIGEIRTDIKNVDTRTAVISLENRVSKLEGNV